ncbi:hypothetical protein [Spiroplasma sp. DGKH1]|uniref:hypothetical protein n=1 Tax=Spiroplasma sp. DGKH1 TaxID=3050074 RepID=UPI0034C672A0
MERLGQLENKMKQEYLCKLIYINQKYNLQLQNTEKAIFVLLPEPYQEYGFYIPKTLLMSSNYWKSIGIKIFSNNIYKLFLYNQKYKQVVKTNFKEIVGNKIIWLFEQVAISNKEKYLADQEKLNNNSTEYSHHNLISDLEKW